MAEIQLLLFSETILQLYFHNHIQKASPCSCPTISHSMYCAAGRALCKHQINK